VGLGRVGALEEWGHRYVDDVEVRAEECGGRGSLGETWRWGERMRGLPVTVTIVVTSTCGSLFTAKYCFEMR
jgi:hypothetical protein